MFRMRRRPRGALTGGTSRKGRRETCKRFGDRDHIILAGSTGRRFAQLGDPARVSSSGERKQLGGGKGGSTVVGWCRLSQKQTLNERGGWKGVFTDRVRL